MLRLIVVLSLVIFGTLRAESFAQIVAGSSTLGGLRSSATVLRVTTLANSGSGSLREAVAKSFPRVIVFDVSGYINLTGDLVIKYPYLTIAGQTAPSPGIILRGGTVRIKTHNVVIEHIGIYPGSSSSSEVNSNRDAAALEGSYRASSEVILRNVSLGWAVDENFSTWFPATRKIRLESSIIAEALNRAGHPEGPHSTSILVGQDTQQVLIAGNLIANGVLRNPAIGCGASSFVANNLTYNPGRLAIHLLLCSEAANSAVSIIGNVVLAGPDTRAGEWAETPISAIVIPQGFQNEYLRIYQADNKLQASRPDQRLGPMLLNYPNIPFATNPPIVANWARRASPDVEAYVLRYAGMRPNDRNPIDARIISDVRLRQGSIINTPADVGGWPSITFRRATALVPSQAFAISSDGRTFRIAAWLCIRHFEVGGPRNQGCPNTLDHYRALLD